MDRLRQQTFLDYKYGNRFPHQREKREYIILLFFVDVPYSTRGK
jgi:hypothetical protein